MKSIYSIAVASLLAVVGLAGPVAAQPTPKVPMAGDVFSYKKVDERSLRLFVIKPDDWKETDRRPAIVFFHGGGWRGGNPSQFEEASQYFAKRGVVCFNVEYRLQGKDEKDPPAKCIADAKSAMRWVRARAESWGVDPTKIAASGGSAGGHLAAATGMLPGLDDPQDDLKVSPRPDALVLFNPVIDNSDEGYGSDRIGDRLQEFSPAHNVTSQAPPTLIMVGSEDRILSPPLVHRFEKRMRDAGVRCDAKIYEGQGHSFFNYRDGKNEYYYKTIADADAFLTSLGWLKPTTEKVGRADEKPVVVAKSTSIDLGEKEADARVQADGKDWRLQKAKIADPSLPRVLLIGDSILNGYLDGVTQALKGKAYVDAWVTPTSQANGRLPQILKEIAAQGPYDVIHFNLGLHGWQPGRIPEGQFIPLSRKLVQALRETNPGAKLIWANTTPVTKQGAPGELDPEVNPIIVEHNRLAMQVMREEGVAVDDLYALMSDKLQLARGDRFHWQPEGREVQAAAVAAAVRQALK
jgi:acetyl esterase/lipase